MSTLLKEGDLAPSFSGVNQDQKELKLADFKGKKLILYFYPKDQTPGCTAQACNLSEYYDQWTKLGYEVLGVSADSAEAHLKFIAKHNLKFNLIADTERNLLEKYDAWGEKSMYGKKYMGILRKTYVIDEEGIILKIIDKVKTKEHTQQLLKELDIK